jgi:ABC-type glycerol-3-phosphate transport system substrate-binding protein
VRKLHLFALPALLLALALGLAACGGGGESAEDKITGTIENAATSNDPAVCDETQTLAFMEQTSGSSGKEAKKECEKEAKSGEGQPDSVNVSNVKVNGEKATANVEFKGGNLDGQTPEVALVEESGSWKLDELTGFAKFDPETLVNAFAEQIEEEPEVKPQVASCIVEGMEELSKGKLENLVIENNSQPIVEIAESCE